MALFVECAEQVVVCVSCTDVTGRPEDHHTLQVVVVFVQLKHLQTLEVKSEQSQKQNQKHPATIPESTCVCEMKHNHPGCSIGDGNVASLCDMLNVNTSVTKLNLNSHHQ